MAESSRIRQLTELGKLERLDNILLLVAIILLPMIVLILDNKIILCIYSILFVGLNIIFGKRYNKLEEKPFLYRPLKWILIFSSLEIIIIAISSSFELINPTAIVLALLIYSYLFILLTCLFYIINWFYIKILKKIFPEEGEREEDQKPSLKDLSRFIDLDLQKNYLTILILEIFVYIIMSLYFMGLVVKYSSVTGDSPLSIITGWADKQSYLTIFNGISLFSFAFAIYTITFPWKRRFINKVHKEYKNKNKSIKAIYNRTSKQEKSKK